MTRSFTSNISYASASLTAALLTQFYQSKAQFFYITEMKLSPSSYALAIAIWAVWNSINDPLAGWLMDNNKTRWGRRLPWMILFTLPLTVSFGLIWSPPQVWLGNDFLLFAWLTAVLLVFDTGYTVVILAWAALFPEIYVEHSERNAVSALRQFFSLIALVLALIIPPFFVRDNDIPSYALFGWILAGVSLVNLIFSFYGCRERDFPQKSETSYSIREGISLILTNRSFRTFLLANLITYFAYGQVLAFIPFYRNFILNEEESFETFAYGGAIGITLISLYFWVKLTTRKDPRFTYIFSAIFFSIAIFPLWFDLSPSMAILFMTFAGFGLAGLLMVVDLLLAQIIDEDYLENGIRREGIFFGFNGFFIRLAILLQAISLAIISEATNFDNNSETQTALAQQGIKLQMVILPIIAFTIGILFIWKFYGIHGDKLLDQRRQIQKFDL